MRRLFGTDGVRGVANVEPMTAETALRLGRAAAHLFKTKDGTRRHRIVIGKDTRLSGYMIESALTSGICSMGVDVLLVGPLPTPGIAFITRCLRADAGIVISASHNPFEDNGIKFFSRDGFKLPDETENRMEDLIRSNELDRIRPTAGEIGKAFRVDDAAGRYIEFVKTSVPKGLDFTGLRVVVDCANGAAYRVAPAVLRELGAEVIALGDRPDGTNINRGCGAVDPAAMQRVGVEYRANLGIALDGDADRAIFADENGRLVDGDGVLAACALAMHREGRLKGAMVVCTVMSTLALDLTLAREGVRTVRAPVGDRYVLERMLREGANLGGEQSGHLIFLDHGTTGDGLITALQVIGLLRRSGKSLSELAAVLRPVPQVLLNVRVREKPDLSDLEGYTELLARTERDLGGSGRVLVRYSGTESVARVLVEGEDPRRIKEMARALADLIADRIGIQTKTGG